MARFLSPDGGVYEIPEELLAEFELLPSDDVASEACLVPEDICESPSPRFRYQDRELSSSEQDYVEQAIRALAIQLEYS